MSAATQAFTPSTLRAWAPIDELLGRRRFKDKVSDLEIIGSGRVQLVVDGEGRVALPPKEAEKFSEPGKLKDLARTLAANLDLRLDASVMEVACVAPGHHRFHGIFGPAVEGGASVAIRVHRMRRTTFEHFLVPEAQAAEIVEAVEAGRGIILSGGTGAGKTTFLNMLIGFIPRGERILTIQDTPELRVPHENHVNLWASRNNAPGTYTWSDAIDTAVRMNPDVIVPGELSIKNAHAVLQAMDTGHEAVMTTMHANSPLDAMRGFRRRIAISGAGDAGVEGVYEFLADTVSFIIQIKQVKQPGGGSVRRVTEIARPKDLLSRLGSRGAGRDLADVRARLIDFNGGTALSEAQQGALEALLCAGLVDPVAPAGFPSPTGEPGSFSPEERMLVEFARQGQNPFALGGGAAPPEGAHGNETAAPADGAGSAVRRQGDGG